ncbi:MAG TPA: 7TM diverse intracellular signaling domain-containing protein, partial [Desulfosarcina sp.]|nr:7TM diverse intracellular signaling domain-containing protein [Desulfosarcina sp.]
MISILLILSLTIGSLLPLVPNPAVAAAQATPPVASRGILALGPGDLERYGAVPLAGQWEFYWDALLSPADFSSATPPERTGWFVMPSVWNGTRVDGRSLGGRGAATFRLRLQVDPGQGRLALLVPYAFTAYRLWVDDLPAAAAGRVGRGADAMVPAYRTRVAFIDPPAGGSVVLTLQIANDMHAKGGMRDTIHLTAASRAPAVKHRALAKDVLVFGCLLIMSIYHLFMFVFRPPDRFNLYFSLCCLLFGLRAALTGEAFLYDIFPLLEWRLAVRLEWLCVYVGAPLCIAYVHALFPREGRHGIERAGLAVGLAMALTTLAAPPSVFTGMFPYLTPLIGAMLIYCAWVLVKAAVHRRFGASVMLACLMIVIVTVINDMLYANDLIRTGHLIPYGMLFFVFSQAMVLAHRSSKAFHRLEATNAAYQEEIRERERAEAEVRGYRDRLADRVRERTDQLAEANRQLQRELDERRAAEAEKLELQERLQRARKMEALGTLAGGVAHDLNNILSGLVGYPDLLLQDLPADSGLRKPLQTIRQSGLKAAAIVQDLLTLARRGIADFQVLDLNRVVAEYLDSPEFDKLIQFHPGVRVASEPCPDLMAVNGSAVHLFKTVMNLVANAAEAMPDGGVVRIRTANRYVDRPTGEYAAVPQGEYVVLSVEDQGIGISKADMERIFEPF